MWPKAYIERVESGGLLRVKFNQKMIVPQGTAYLHNSTIVIEEKLYPAILIEVVPSINSD